MTNPRPQRPFVIIEDSDEDFEVLVWALRQAGVSNPIHRCATAAQIAALLVDRSEWPEMLAAAYPVLVLMDLNLPGTDWRETLAHLRGDRWWQIVPTIIVSTSQQQNDVARCYRMGVAGCLHKPLNLDAFANSIQTVVAYWMNTVVLPAPPDRAERDRDGLG